jgi:hypothetical protein
MKKVMQNKVLGFCLVLALAVSAFASDQTSSKQFTIQVQNITGLTMTPAALPTAIIVNGVGQPYTATLSIAGGTAPYKWTLTGSLPAGLAMAANCVATTCVISGTPAAAAVNATFTIAVEDSTGTIARINLQWDASPSVVTAYNIYRGTASGGPYSKVGSVPASSLVYSETAARTLTKLFYVATAVDSSGTESANSNEAEALLQ